MDYVDYSLISDELTEEDIETKLKEKLDKLGLMTDEQYEKMDNKDKSLLQEVYSVVRVRHINRAKCLKDFKEQEIKVASIAEQINFSRRTLYNKKVAMELITRLQKEEEKTDPFKYLSSLAEKIIELNEMIVRMQARDVTLETLKMEIEEVNKSLAQRIQAYKTLEDENFKLLKRINTLEKLEEKVVSIKGKNAII